MKKITAIFLILIMAFALFSCGEDRRPEQTAAPEQTEKTPAPETMNDAEYAELEAGYPAEAPFLWKVESENGGLLYMLGTIHVGDGRNAEAVERYKPFLDRCGALAVECDTVAFQNDYAAMMKYVSGFMYKDGTKLKDHLSPELYEKLVAVAKEQGYYAAMFENYDLAFWSQILEQQTLDYYTDLSPDSGVDVLLMNYAKDKGYEVREIESVEFQNELFQSFSDELYQILISDSLEDPEETAKQTVDLYELYVKGDEEIFDLLTEDVDEETLAKYTEKQIALYDDYNKKMLDDRNLGMRDRAIEYLKNGDKVFYAVGLAHYVGDAGLISLLEDAGYTVERVGAK